MPKGEVCLTLGLLMDPPQLLNQIAHVLSTWSQSFTNLLLYFLVQLQKLLHKLTIDEAEGPIYAVPRLITERAPNVEVGGVWCFDSLL